MTGLLPNPDADPFSASMRSINPPLQFLTHHCEKNFPAVDSGSLLHLAQVSPGVRDQQLGDVYRSVARFGIWRVEVDTPFHGSVVILINPVSRVGNNLLRDWTVVITPLHLKRMQHQMVRNIFNLNLKSLTNVPYYFRKPTTANLHLKFAVNKHIHDLKRLVLKGTTLNAWCRSTF